jgi:hypothetical protein
VRRNLQDRALDLLSIVVKNDAQQRRDSWFITEEKTGLQYTPLI